MACSCVVCTSLLVLLSEYENVKDLVFCYGVQIGGFHTNTSSQSKPKRQSVLMCGVRDIDSICYEAIFIKGVVRSD